jgi:hypothetical protein
MPATLCGHDVRRIQSVRMRIRDGKCKLYDFHQRNIRRVVTDTRTFSGIDIQALAQLVEGAHLVLRPLDHVFHAELPAADVHHFRFSTRDDGHFDPGSIETLDALAVAHMEYLQRLAAQSKVEMSVGHCSINVQDQ